MEIYFDYMTNRGRDAPQSLLYLETKEKNMKTTRTTLTLIFVTLLLAACGPKNKWTTYQAESGTLVNPGHPSYSFEYPSNWAVEEGVNHIAFASEARLLKNAPDKLNSNQIIASLSMNVNMLPQEMVKTATSTYQGFIEFNEPEIFEKK